MGFKSAAESFKTERADRRFAFKRLLSFGNTFIDDSLLGILPDDLVLVGAPSGVGKTQFCVNLALANLAAGKRVHFFALEAGEYEIERRLKFQVIAEKYYADMQRPSLRHGLVFDEWEIGLYGALLDKYEDAAEEFCVNAFANLQMYYKTDEFNVYKLIEQATYISDETDLIIVDHAHFFDWDDQNDNRAIKEIAKAARDLCRANNKPIVLVAHLRKKDKQNGELAPGIDEFHGSSDLAKIATKAITIASGGPAEEGGYITYIRTPKNRHGTSSSRYLGRIIFNERRGGYEKEYKVGWANAQKFGEIEPNKLPGWVGRSSRTQSGGQGNHDHSGQSRAYEKPKGIRNYAPGADQD